MIRYLSDIMSDYLCSGGFGVQANLPWATLSFRVSDKIIIALPYHHK